jgi:hypothetical protein
MVPDSKGRLEIAIVDLTNFVVISYLIIKQLYDISDILAGSS